MKTKIALFGLATLTTLGCASAPDVPQTTDDEAVIEDETVGTSAEALLSSDISKVPFQAGQSIVYLGNRNYRIQNRLSGRCLRRGANDVDTDACNTTDSGQQFAIFEQTTVGLLNGYDKTHNICRPDTLSAHSATICVNSSCRTMPVYSALCVLSAPVQGHPRTDIRLSRAILAFKRPGQTRYETTIADFDKVPDLKSSGYVHFKISNFAGSYANGYIDERLAGLVQPIYPTAAKTDWSSLSWKLL